MHADALAPKVDRTQCRVPSKGFDLHVFNQIKDMIKDI